MTTIAFSNAIGPVPVDVRMRERLSRQVSVTANPVEVGADVTDHAFLEPQTATLEIAAANAAATWQALKALQD
ncbi:MAG: phage baseplate protein, partial [Pseudomonadota bacterium]